MPNDATADATAEQTNIGTAAVVAGIGNIHALRLRETFYTTTTPTTEAMSGKRVTGKRVRAIAIRAGMSANRRFYSADMLQRAVSRGLFESLPVYLNHPLGFGVGNHDVNGIAGEFTGGTWDAQEQAVVGMVEFLNNVPGVHMQAVMREKPHLVGFSIFANANGIEREDANSAAYDDITELLRVLSLDAVDFPGAGGRALEVTESVTHRDTQDTREENRMDENAVKVRVMEAERVMEADHAKAIAALRESYDAEVVKLREALDTEKAAHAETAKALDTEKAAHTETTKALDAEKAAKAVAEAQMLVDRKLAESKLSSEGQAYVRKQLGGRTVDEATIVEAITDVEKLGAVRSDNDPAPVIPAETGITGMGEDPTPSGDKVAEQATRIGEHVAAKMARCFGE